MRPPLSILLIVPLAGCTLGTHKQAATPPPPTPAAVQAPAPEKPLSTPQTAVTLPSRQEFNPDSIPKETVQEVAVTPEKPETPPPQRVSRRVPAGPQKPEPEPEAETPAPAAPPEQGPIQPILTGEEQRRLKSAIEERKKTINERLSRATGRQSAHDRSLVERIKSFLQQCSEAELRGDFSQADALSERAAVLAQELSK